MDNKNIARRKNGIKANHCISAEKNLIFIKKSITLLIMKKSGIKWIPLFSLILLIVFVWANINYFYFSHIHIDENGGIIVHAHPYKTDSPSTEPFPAHTHNVGEMHFLAMLYHFAAILAVFLLVYSFILSINHQFRVNSGFFFKPFYLISSDNLKRGPPVFV